MYWELVKRCKGKKDLYKCKCGTEKMVQRCDVISGKSTQCRSCARRTYNKHGKKGSRTYIVWCNMKARCYNKNRRDYKYYGGRGITVCNKWLEFKKLLC